MGPVSETPNRNGLPCRHPKQKKPTSESTAKRILLDCSSAADDELNVKQPKAVAGATSYEKLHA